MDGPLNNGWSTRSRLVCHRERKKKKKKKSRESETRKSHAYTPQPLLPWPMDGSMELEVGSSRNSGSALASRLRCCLLCCAIRCHQELDGAASPSPSPLPPCPHFPKI